MCIILHNCDNIEIDISGACDQTGTFTRSSCNIRMMIMIQIDLSQLQSNSDSLVVSLVGSKGQGTSRVRKWSVLLVGRMTIYSQFFTLFSHYGVYIHVEIHHDNGGPVTVAQVDTSCLGYNRIYSFLMGRTGNSSDKIRVRNGETHNYVYTVSLR